MNVFVVTVMSFVTNLFCCNTQEEYRGEDSISSVTTVVSHKQR